MTMKRSLTRDVDCSHRHLQERNEGKNESLSNFNPRRVGSNPTQTLLCNAHTLFPVSTILYDLNMT